MIWDEVVDLDEQFWEELQTAETKFLWRPRVNALTGKRMWLCWAVCAKSGRKYYAGNGAEFGFTTTHWYKPRDFIIEKLKR